MHGIASVFFFYYEMGFPKCDSIFNIAFPFLDSFDKMGSLMHFVGMARLDLKLSGVDL